MGSTHFCCAITIILVIEIYFVSASKTTRYPTRFYPDNSTFWCTNCTCMGFCEDNQAMVGEGTCVTAQEGQYYSGGCPFGHPVNRINRKFSGDPDV